MDFSQLVQTFLSFIFVIGLLFITLWFIKICQQKGLNCKLSRCLCNNKRIKIIEQHRLDIRNQISLIQCDNTEYLVLLGQNSHTILNQTKKTTKAS